MEFDEWMQNEKERDKNANRKCSRVELRMISDWNTFALCKKGKPTYGIYRLTNEDIASLTEEGCDINTPHMFNVHFGGISEPEVSFSVEGSWRGYQAKRNHDGYYRGGEVQGISLTKRGADKKSYHAAVDTGEEIAKYFDAEFMDSTPKDLLKLRDYVDELNLEKRVWKYKERAGI